ncbi:putative harbinger transposase-derived nuclease domain-containing protein [Helianthus annuus]|nr:putative harbinger transposase-derived nuclease domain-containing protein [Helianthus annuus]
MRHSSARNVIERCFGILKAGWGILKDHSYYPIDQKNRMIMACCLLHNFIRREMPVDPFETGVLLDEGFGDGHGDGDGDGDRDGDEDNITYIETSNEWTTFRNNLAQSMFDASNV